MKKRLCIIVILLLFGMNQIFTAPCGDVNSSGAIDIVDALITAQYYVGLNPQPYDVSAGDVSGDGLINIVDALQTARYYVGLITTLEGCEIPTVPPAYISLSVDNNYHVYRNGPLDADVVYVIERVGDGIVLNYNGKYSLDYRYLELQSGRDYRIWLQAAGAGKNQRVSNTIEFTVEETFNYYLSVDSQYALHRSGAVGNMLTWVIEKDGAIVLQRNAANEVDYTYYNNTTGSYFRAWLIQFINGEYRRVSNYIEYRAGESIQYEISVDQSHRVSRTGPIGIPVHWVVEKNRSVLNTYASGDSLQMIEYDHEQGQYYRVWLENDDNEIISNIVEYVVDDIMQLYTLTVAADGTLQRDGSLGDRLGWIIEQDGRVVLDRNASNELSYQYYDIQPGAGYRSWLEQHIDGGYQRVSNIVQYSF